MRAGAAEIDITPRVGVDLTGYVARLGPSVGVHDPLHARALVMDDGTTRAALVVCDLLGLNGPFVEVARRQIAEALDAAPEAVMVACTHTHSGPATFFLRQCGRVDSGYQDALWAKLIEVATRAAAELRTVRVGVAQGDLPTFAFDRRGAGAVVDTTVPVAVFSPAPGAAPGTAVASVVGYGCHPVTMNPDNLLISADYPGAAAQAMAEALGGIALFVTGADGNVNPVSRGSFDDVQRHGEALAAEAVRALSNVPAVEPGRLIVAREVLDLPLMAPPPADALAEMATAYRVQLREAETAGEPVAIRIARAMLGWAEATARRVAWGRVATSVRAEIQVIAAGPAIWVGLPLELFSGLGAQIKAAGGGRPVFIVGYANGDVGYLPDRAAYAEGGYEVADAYKYYDAPAPLAPEAGDMVVAAGRRLVKEAVG